MTWNYGIVKHMGKFPYYAVHEIYRGEPELEAKKGTGVGWTEDPVTVTGDSPEELVEALEMMLKDIKGAIAVNEIHEDTMV
jgi:hypothetical protein